MMSFAACWYQHVLSLMQAMEPLQQKMLCTVPVLRRATSSTWHGCQPCAEGENAPAKCILSCCGRLPACLHTSTREGCA